MGFLKKTFKKIKKGVKKVIGKVGKVFNKLGPLGTIGLMIAAPYAINAMFGTNLSTLTSAKAATKATTDVATEATEEVIKKEVIKEGTKLQKLFYQKQDSLLKMLVLILKNIIKIYLPLKV